MNTAIVNTDQQNARLQSEQAQVKVADNDDISELCHYLEGGKCTINPEQAIEVVDPQNCYAGTCPGYTEPMADDEDIDQAAEELDRQNAISLMNNTGAPESCAMCCGVCSECPSDIRSKED
jgi:hypothetical protein